MLNYTIGHITPSNLDPRRNVIMTVVVVLNKVYCVPQNSLCGFNKYS